MAAQGRAGRTEQAKLTGKASATDEFQVWLRDSASKSKVEECLEFPHSNTHVYAHVNIRKYSTHMYETRKKQCAFCLTFAWALSLLPDCHRLSVSPTHYSYSLTTAFGPGLHFFLITYQFAVIFTSLISNLDLTGPFYHHSHKQILSQILHCKIQELLY